MQRLETLQRIAALALMLRSLERELAGATDSRLVMERLKETRSDLDAELEVMRQEERE